MMKTSLRRLAAAAIALFSLVAPAAAQVPVDVVHTFVPGEPSFPSSLVTAPDGTIYGSSEKGGFFDGSEFGFNAGTVFRVASDGTVTVVRSFDESLRRPHALVFTAGALFGVADGPSAPRGAVFAMNPDGNQFRIVHAFSDATGGGNQWASLVGGADGRLYGVSPDLPYGRIFQLDPATGVFTVLHLFDNSDGQVVWPAPFIAGSDGNLYGVAESVVYKLAPSGAFTVLKRFVCGTDVPCVPIALPGMIDGNLFVEMQGGSVARLPTGGGAPTVISLNSFQSSRWAGWILAGDGNFYAVRNTEILRLTPQGSAGVIRTLGPGEGGFDSLQQAPMTLAADGAIVGAVSGPRGRIFRFTTDGSFAWLHSMTASPEGAAPSALVRGADGALYGTAQSGGAFDLGTAFRVAPDGTFTVLHNFSGAADGGRPRGLTLASDGNFYGTAYGGTPSGGLLFRMSPGGTVTPMHNFGADAAARGPENMPMQASDGALYGMTNAGIYRCTLDGTFTIVHTFAEFSVFPGEPSPVTPAPLVEMDRTLYGALASYNLVGDGLPPSDPFIFALTLEGAYRQVAVYDESFDLNGALVAGHDGNLYGTTRATFFRITPSGSRTDLVTMLPNDQGYYGHAFNRTLIQAADGDFYCGFLADFNANEPGGLCRVTIAGRFSKVSNRIPEALLQRPDGAIEGTNYRSGLHAEGPAQIFRFTLPQQMALVSPGAGTTAPQPFRLSGWAIDRTSTAGPGVDAVHVWAYPSGGGAPAFVGVAWCQDASPDVMAVYGAAFANAGFSLTVDGLAPGTYTLVAFAHSSETGTFNQWRVATVAVTTPRPAIAIDAPSGTAGPAFIVRGWALDAGATAGAGVDAIHVYVFAANGSATFLGVADYGGARPDVGAIYGPQFTNSSFSLTTSASLAPGHYTLVVYARSTVSGAFFSQSRSITVREPGDPLMTIDTPRPETSGAGASQPFNLAGWAIDRDATSGPGVDTVHVWAFPTDGGAARFVGVANFGGARGDVGAAYGSQFTNSGYNVTVSGLAAGQYQIAVYARSTVTGTFNQSRIVIVTVQP